MDSLITYFEVWSSLIIAFFFMKWFVVKIMESNARSALEHAIKYDEPYNVKAVLISRAKLLSSEAKVDAENWISRYKGF